MATMRSPLLFVVSLVTQDAKSGVMQSVDSFDFPVPLVAADGDALDLFVTAAGFDEIAFSYGIKTRVRHVAYLIIRWSSHASQPPFFKNSFNNSNDMVYEQNSDVK